MQENKNKYYDIAERIYDLDGEVYECVGSSLGRTFTGDKRTCVNNLVMLMRTKPQGHLLRSELALISNMARTIRKDEDRSRLMKKYDEILKEIAELPASFGKVEILDENRAKLNTANLRQKFSKDDHLIICIGRTQGSAGNDIGFALAEALHINYYDESVLNQILDRRDAKEFGADAAKVSDFKRYHGLSKKDASFFRQSALICELAKEEDMIVMGRAADVVLTGQHIPHISIFISAPFQVRVQHVMDVRNMNMKQAVKFLKKMDKQHRKYYEFYSGEKWGKPENYDLCINSANYGIKETIDVIKRLLNQQTQ